MNQVTTFDQSYTNYQLQRSWLRRLIRKFYLRNVRLFCSGPTIDFGCGVGELLEMLPQGSVGLEVNSSTVGYCRTRGLNVIGYFPDLDRYQLKDLQPDYYKTFVVSHVLEHLDDSAEVLKTLLRSCSRLGVETVVVVVPGVKGFAYDKTHRTFIDEHYLDRCSLWNMAPWSVTHTERFPFNFEWVGRIFTHNEFIIVYRNF